MLDLALRSWLTMRWHLTPFRVKQEATWANATTFEASLDQAKQMGPVVPYEQLQPPIEGPNAAEVYEAWPNTIKPLASKANGTFESLKKLAVQPTIHLEEARRTLEVWEPTLNQTRAAVANTDCRLDPRYILEETRLEPLDAVKQLSTGMLARIRIGTLSESVETCAEDLACIGTLVGHAAAEPLLIGALFSATIHRHWFAGASQMLRIPELRGSVRDSLTKLSPIATIRSTLPGEVFYATQMVDWPFNPEMCDRCHLPRGIVRDLQKLDGYWRAVAAGSIRSMCRLGRQLPPDELTAGQAGAAAYYRCQGLQFESVIGIPEALVRLNAARTARIRAGPLYKTGGAFPAVSQSMRNVVGMALECYEARERLGRFPLDLGSAMDPVSGRPYEYRNHGERFVIFGDRVEFDSDPSGLLT